MKAKVFRHKRKQPYSTTCPYPQLAKVRPSRVPKPRSRGRPNPGILPDYQFSTGLHSHLECIALAFASKQEKTTLFNYLSVLYFLACDYLIQINDKYCLYFFNALQLDVLTIYMLGLLDTCPK